jgi:hypothetical protein
MSRRTSRSSPKKKITEGQEKIWYYNINNCSWSSYPFFPLSFTPYFFLFILYVYQYLQMAVFLALAFPGVSLLVYQLSVYPHTNKILGPIKTSRVAAVSKNW